MENPAERQKNSRCAGKRIFFGDFPQKSEEIHKGKRDGFSFGKVFRKGSGQDQPRLISFMISLMVASRMGSVDNSVSTALMLE